MDPGRPRVLLLERNGALRQVLTEALDDLGFEVHGASGRKQALQVLLDEPAPDLLLVDLVDEGAGGEAFLAFVAAHPEATRAPAVLMTDGPCDPHAPAGARVLPKPFGLDELRAALGGALGERAQGGAPDAPR